MKARVFVSFKPTVLDPQGQTIRGALNSLGHSSIAAVRQGKFFDIELAAGAASGQPQQDQAKQEQAKQEMDQIAREVLANPVIEDYRIEFLD
ncbi:MAG: phosphoribosylformylglycinamidine synthase subunit PurS [Acidobacteriota bacterium]|nr:phosphoribosylformylglycinamidine synthase subunit PurS [Acidobacteriota bacterium]